MALTLPPFSLEVNVNDIASKIVESEAGPVINLGVSLKLSISELLQALQQYQHKNRDVAKAKAEPKEAALLAATQPGPLTSPATQAPAQAGTAEDKPGVTVLTQMSAWPSNMQNITWDNEIGDLQLGREEYAAKCRWEPIASSKQWILVDEAPLVQNLKIKGLKCTPLAEKAPTPKTVDLAHLEAMANDKLKETMNEMSNTAKTDQTRPHSGASSSVAAISSTPGSPPAAAPKAEGAVSAEPRVVPPMPSSAPPGPPATAATAASTAARPNAGPPPGLSPPRPGAAKTVSGSGPPEDEAGSTVAPTGSTCSAEETLSEREKAERDGKECKQQ